MNIQENVHFLVCGNGSVVTLKNVFVRETHAKHMLKCLGINVMIMQLTFKWLSQTHTHTHTHINQLIKLMWQIVNNC